MAKFQEVEQKYPLLNNDEVVAKLGQLKSKKILLDEYQIDTYYTPQHKDYLDNEIVSEWLRVRETKNGASINFKRWLPIGAVRQTHCDEYESKIDNAEAIKLLLEAIEAKEIIVVNKNRNSWIYDDIEISIDSVKDLGAFIELESINKLAEDEIESMHLKMRELLVILGAKVGEQDFRGYPYQLIAQKRK